MKKWVWISVLVFIFLFSISHPTSAQCSICTRTAQQLGEKPSQGLNQGILYLVFTPFIIAGVVFYRWRKKNGKVSSY